MKWLTRAFFVLVTVLGAIGAAIFGLGAGTSLYFGLKFADAMNVQMMNDLQLQFANEYGLMALLTTLGISFLIVVPINQLFKNKHPLVRIGYGLMIAAVMGMISATMLAPGIA